MDGAGWHKSKSLQVPENIKIILLPPYSPELNPVERFWQYLKQNTIKNQVYTNIKELKNSLQKFLNSIPEKIVKSLCTVNYIS
jgi:transposase